VTWRAPPRAVALCALLVACGRGTAPSAATADGAKAQDAAAVVAPMDRVREELWTQARGGEAGDLARLAEKEGESGLVERAASDPASRMTALRAMAFAPEPGAFAVLPFLAEVARGTDEAQAAAALESAIDLAARPRRAIDPEDAAEMKAGCDSMLALANDAKAARLRRVNAIRALRMLADRGCVESSAIPTDLDAR
jgi:hypothetical protein